MKIKTTIILTVFLATAAICSSTANAGNAANNAPVKKPTAQQTTVTQQQADTGTNAPRSINNNNRNRTNWSKIKDMFM